MSTPTADPPAHWAYRPDIDGLRAVAVLPVIFYHLGVSGFGGGFVGVDIFFVISGYLITQVLTDARRPISLPTFYARRVRRLAPALFVMVVAATVAALILMPPRALISYGESLLSLSAGGSNIYFWKSLAGYFAAAAEVRPLLHTWSLAVEEQFYLLFPLYLMLISWLGPRWRLAGVAIVAIASFALAAWLAPRAPSASFYLPPARAWELLVGSTLALAPIATPRGLATVLAAIGLALMAYAVVTFDSHSQVPGLAALVPGLGAVLVLHAGSAAPGNPVSRLLSFGPLVGVGVISYGLYLWHWPIKVFADHYLVIDAPAAMTVVSVLALSTAAAVLSWRFIEQPIRRGALIGTTPKALSAALVMSLILAVTAVWIVRTQGLSGRQPALAAIALPLAEQPEDVGLFTFLRPPQRPPVAFHSGWLFQKPPPATRRVMVWGDSFARRLLPGLSASKAQAPFSVYDYTALACPPVIAYRPLSIEDCHAHNQAALGLIRAQGIDTVIVAANWQSYMSTGKLPVSELTDTVRRLRGMGLTVLVIGQPPLYAFDYPDEYHYRQMKLGAGRDEGQAASTADPRLNVDLAQAFGVDFFDPTPIFCQAGRCTYRTGGQYMVRDLGHLSDAGSTRLTERLVQTPQLRAPGDRPGDMPGEKSTR